MKKLLIYIRDQATERSLAPIRVVGLEEWLSMKDKLRPGELACQDGIFNVVTGGKLPYTGQTFYHSRYDNEDEGADIRGVGKCAPVRCLQIL